MVKKLFTHSIFFVFIVFICAGAVHADLNDGLVAHYTFDGNTNDETSNGNNGTKNGGVSYVEGVSGQAVKFGGCNNPGYIIVPESASLRFDKQLSISYFVRINSYTHMDSYGGCSYNAGSGTVIAKDHDRSGFLSKVAARTNGTFSVSFSNNHFSNPRLDVYAKTTNPAYALGDWAHIVIVIDDNVGKIYINSSLESTKEIVTDFSVANTKNLYIGKFRDTWYPLNGTVDELRFYNRALSSSEVNALYSLVAPPFNPEQNLIAYYPFNNGQLTDESPNGGNDAIAVNEAIKVTDRSGDTEGAFYFDGINDSIELPDFKNHSNYTFSAWIKWEGGSFYQTVLAIEDGYLGLNCDENGFYYFSWDNRAGGPDSYTTNLTSSGLLPGEWMHVAVTAEGTGSLDLYVNGQLSATEFINNNSADTYAGDYIGSLNDEKFYFHGSIDDVRIYDQALSAYEINALYALEKFTQQHQLSVNVEPSIAGSVTITGSPLLPIWPQTFDEGTVVSLSPSPASGFKFSHWTGALQESSNPGVVTMGEDKDITAVFEPNITDTNYIISNTGTSSDSFQVFVDLAVLDNQNDTALCSEYEFSARNQDGTQNITAENCQCIQDSDPAQTTGTTRYFLSFKIPESATAPHAATIEKAHIWIHNRENGWEAKLPGLGADGISVYGTTFDITRDAWSFANGEWNYTEILSNLWTPMKDISTYLSQTNQYHPKINDRITFFKNVGTGLSPDGLAEKTYHGQTIQLVDKAHFSDGLCYGLVNCAVAQMNHSGEDVWGPWKEGLSDLDIETNWIKAINDRWDTQAGRTVAPHRPLPINKIYEARWKDEAVFRKIMYYFVGQPHFGAGTNWVGKDRYIQLQQPAQSQPIDTIRNILEKGSPVNLSIQLDHSSGHNMCITEMIRWEGHDKYIIWDNNRPYKSDEKLTEQIEQADKQIEDATTEDLKRTLEKWKLNLLVQKTTTPYLSWYIDDNAAYSKSFLSSTASLIYYVSRRNGNEFIVKYRLFNSLPSIMGSGSTNDPQNIYNQWTTGTTSSLKKTVKTVLSDETEEQPVAWGYPNHLELFSVGGSVDTVLDNATNGAVPLYPGGEVVLGRAVRVDSCGGLFSTVYLPVDRTYKVQVTKSPDVKDLEIFVTIPHSDGTLEQLHYQGLETGPTDATVVTFTVGLGNDLINASRSYKGNPAPEIIPDVEENIVRELPPPSHFTVLHEGLNVTLKWENPNHPLWDRVRIERTQNVFPQTTEDGELVYEGTANQATDELSAPGIWYYAIFSLDTAGNVSSPAIAGLNTGLFEITGTVTTEVDEGVENVCLELKNAAGDVVKSSSTGNSGFFAIENIADGAYTLCAAASGYGFSISEKAVVIDGGNETVDFLASPLSAIYLDAPENVRIGQTVYPGWTISNLATDETVCLKYNINGVWKNVATGIGVLKGNATWPVEGPTAENAILRVELESDPQIYDEVPIVIQNAFLEQGDINGDFIVSIADAVLALQISSHIDVAAPVAQVYYTAGGKVDTTDVIQILQFISGLRDTP